MCEQQYFFEYVLGWRGPSNKKADKGTIVHKVLEILAMLKQAKQNKQKTIADDVVGKLSVAEYSLDTIIEKVYQFYTTQFAHHEWEKKDYKDCYNWVYKAINYAEGMFDPRNRTIVCPEQRFDIEIKKPWAAYKYDINGEVLEGNLAIKGTIDLITQVDDSTYEIIDWKGLPIDTKLPTPNGWITIGEIGIGYNVFDQYGNICQVVGKSKVKTKKCFRITFDDATSVVCDDEHLWKLSNGETVSIQDLVIGDTINVAKPLKCNEEKLPIDPYLLGVWLGDGRNRNCEISGNDTEIFEEIRKRGYKLGKIKNDKRSKNKTVTILDVTKILKSLNLLNNKHIPDIYLRSSFQQRLDLLRGLMDTDGNANQTRKQAVFTNCNKKLSDDVKHLLLTLGQRPCQSIVNRDTNFKKNVKVYPISFRPIDINPFLLKRKQQAIDINWGAGRSRVRRVTRIEESIIQKTQCIAVNSPDNTYLCTENFIPTHNTGRRLDWATGTEKTQAKLEVDPQLRIYHYAIKHLYPDIQNIIVTIDFINDGGPFSVCFGPDDIKATEDMLRDKFEYIKKTKKPRLNKTWMCNKLCHFGKTTFDNTHITPIKEYRDNQLTPHNQTMTKCEQVRHDIELKGINEVVDEYTMPGYSVGNYKAPGSVE